jgi:hypothetical protein
MQVEQLERELASVRSSPSSARGRLVPTTNDVLLSLGIGSNKQQKEEEGSSSGNGSVDLEMLRRLPLSTSAGRRGSGGPAAGGRQATAGVVSLRTAILVAYLVVMHVALMMSMAKHTHCHHAAAADMLPGQ